MRCVFIRRDSETELCERHMDPPLPGDFVTDLPGLGTQEWYVERRRIRARQEVMELWVSLVA